jgi:hypothetical protein
MGLPQIADEGLYGDQAQCATGIDMIVLLPCLLQPAANSRGVVAFTAGPVNWLEICCGACAGENTSLHHRSRTIVR